MTTREPTEHDLHCACCAAQTEKVTGMPPETLLLLIRDAKSARDAAENLDVVAEDQRV